MPPLFFFIFYHKRMEGNKSIRQSTQLLTSSRERKPSPSSSPFLWRANEFQIHSRHYLFLLLLPSPNLQRTTLHFIRSFFLSLLYCTSLLAASHFRILYSRALDGGAFKQKIGCGGALARIPVDPLTQHCDETAARRAKVVVGLHRFCFPLLLRWQVDRE